MEQQTKELGGSMGVDLVVLETLLELGTLQIWCANTPQQVAEGLRPTHYFWRDAGSPQGFGPFARLYDAMEHYKATIQMLNSAKVSQPGRGQVIQVDFVNKRRI